MFQRHSLFTSTLLRMERPPCTGCRWPRIVCGKRAYRQRR
ncbi:Hypothetical protein AA314_09133 [Archangium gephyra]|uniref:Uncharacterized protein n=1 Tax=Archangium gephyra TaxID=48 RepID=A0AAC8QGU9_9BACT|nr:Hypothetical protein AA314_09133 [Archangium gephyra]